jgi:predicted ATP-dependent protease
MRELAADALSWTCPEEWVPWTGLEDVQPADTIVAQDRAVEAIGFGLDMRGIGYNVFVTGLSGTGRLTTIKRFLDQEAGDGPTPDDVCFVFSFRAPEEPRAVFLAAGAGRRLRDGMEELVDQLSKHIPEMLSDTEFRRRVDRAVADLKERERTIVTEFEKELAGAGFQLVHIQIGPLSRPEILPQVDDKPVPLEELPKLVEKGTVEAGRAEEMQELHARFTERLHEVFQAVAEIRVQAQERVEKIKTDLLGPAIDEMVDRVAAAVDDERARDYLDAVRADVRDNLDRFTTDASDDEGGERFQRWRVNLAVDNAETKGRPVVLETEPSYTNLFGTIERSLTPSGEISTSFLKIRAGSLMQANGGYLVLNAEDLLMEARVWPGLKRALKYRRVQIQTLESLILGAAVLKPEPVPLRVKVVVIGDRRIYDALYRYDSEFSKVFKVLADFDSVISPSSDAARDILSVLRKVADEEGLLMLDRSGMAAILEEAVRMGRWRHRFSSRFSDLSDLLREASWHAGRDGADRISASHVGTAQAAYQRRHGLTEDRTHDFIAEGVVHVDTDGVAVGTVNGLAVHDLGHHRFGRPSRISARVGVGRDGVINIERQAGLSGPTHDKGVQILTGFLRGTFAQRVPLTMSCSVTFEQSYGGIDGDSASSTEIYAILSSLADLPIRQDIAVTGSVDQHGRIQAIGGVNEKIEGFFRVCDERGLSGTQGVMIPGTNVGDLQLDAEVRQAVTDGRFHVWSVETVEEGIELLTGVPAGEWADDGWSPEDGVYARCASRLEDMSRLMRKAGKDPDSGPANDAKNDVTEPPEEPPDDPET